MADHALTLRLEESLWQRIRKDAFERETTISAVIREALSDRYSENESEED